VSALVFGGPQRKIGDPGPGIWKTRVRNARVGLSVPGVEIGRASVAESAGCRRVVEQLEELLHCPLDAFAVLGCDQVEKKSADNGEP